MRLIKTGNGTLVNVDHIVYVEPRTAPKKNEAHFYIRTNAGMSFSTPVEVTTEEELIHYLQSGQLIITDRKNG